MYYDLQDKIQASSNTTGTGILKVDSINESSHRYFPANMVGNKIYYTVTDGTNWEVGIGRYTGGLIRDEVLSSSNSNNLVNFPAGTKNVIITLAALGTQSGTATGDDSSIASDLNAWNKVRSEIEKNVEPYNNFGIAGIGSTYSLISSGTYTGGVLDPNGDIHFVPFSATVGQKVSAAGVVSTYSLIYTTTFAYFGGVLAPNGDIHFVPYLANRGQKVSASGIVSTYSILLTSASGAYTAGVLAPNGDIHFVPYAANRGQKVSAAGVVSTYSLVFTSGSGAYIGGVLAPNGDIHFVPSSANRGQKISSAGVVST
jgi:hypothetical protein